MQHINLFFSLISAVLCFAYLYDQYIALAWLFAIISRLRRARKKRGWSIEEAAWQVGVDTSTYHRWELGTQKPHGQNKRKVEAAFQMRASDLFEKDLYEQELGKFIDLLLMDFRPTFRPTRNNVVGVEAVTVAHQDGHVYLCEVKAWHEK